MARKAKSVTQAPTAPTAMDVTVTQVGAGPRPAPVLFLSQRFACEGCGGALGIPRVWPGMGAAGSVDCPYCDRRFVATTAAGHDEDEHLAPGVYEGSGGH